MRYSAAKITRNGGKRPMLKCCLPLVRRKVTSVSARFSITVGYATWRDYPDRPRLFGKRDALKVVKTIGIVLGVAVLTSATLFLVGSVTSLLGNMGWLHLGEDQPCLEYGFPLGILIGVIVAVRKARNPTAGIVELILKPLLMRIPR